MKIGWKHFQPHLKRFVLVPAAHGGAGSDSNIKIQRSATMSDVISILCDIFFPNGRSINGMNASDCEMLLAKFSGEEIEFATFGEYRDNEKVSPLRVYLHTYGVSTCM